MDRQDRYERAIIVFRNGGGVLRTAEALEAGVHPGTLYAMRDRGILERVSRGVYRLAEGMPLWNPDLVTVAARIPSGVICLISALSFHELTTQIPHEVYVALPKGAEEPRLSYPPVRTFRFSGRAFTEGIETHDLDGVQIRIYGREKTLADCFKFRNRIGLDVAVEALRFYFEQGKVDLDGLLRLASVCRVAKVMRPYIEAML